MFKTVIRIKARCPNHRFNPQTADNLAARKASCLHCERLVLIYTRVIELERLQREAEQFMPVPKKRTLKVEEADETPDTFNLGVHDGLSSRQPRG